MRVFFAVTILLMAIAVATVDATVAVPAATIATTLAIFFVGSVVIVIITVSCVMPYATKIVDACN